MAKTIEYPDTIQDAVEEVRDKSVNTLGKATLNIVVFMTTSQTIKLQMKTILFSCMDSAPVLLGAAMETEDI